MSVAADVLGEVVVGGVVEGQAGWQGQVWHHLPQIFCNFSEIFYNLPQNFCNFSEMFYNLPQIFHHLPQIFCNFSEMSPLPLPSGVAYGGEVADELEMVEEEVGSVAQPLSMIVICL